VKDRTDKLLKGGLKVTTTFDETLQNEAVDATNNAKPQKGPDWISSLVSIDPTSGAVKAMVGGPDFADSQYNIATHPIGRQPGSTWKVITLAGALQNGYSPNDQVDGTAPCSVKRFGNVTTNNAEAGGGIENLWSATSGSVNCAFVRLSTSVGQDKLITLAHQMGIQQTRPTQNDQFLTLSIGTVEATPLEMATVMATIANGGVHHKPYVVAKVVGPDGKVLLDNTNDPGDEVLTKDVAACETNVLRGVVTGGTGTNANISGQEIFGKTGTTDNRADAWFIGANPAGSGQQLATAVWFGNRTGQIAGAGFGGDSSAPIFRAFMSQALANQPENGLPDPGPVCARPGQFVNPDGGRGAEAPTDTSPLPTVSQTPTVTPGTPTTTPVTPAPVTTPTTTPVTPPTTATTVPTG
jgi:penicillin-binding protein 1A